MSKLRIATCQAHSLHYLTCAPSIAITLERELMATRTWNVRSPEDLGHAVAEIRRARGMTQEDLAERGGLTRTWLSKLETGHSTSVLDHLLRLLRRLGATVTITFGDDLG